VKDDCGGRVLDLNLKLGYQFVKVGFIISQLKSEIQNGIFKTLNTKIVK